MARRRGGSRRGALARTLSGATPLCLAALFADRAAFGVEPAPPPPLAREATEVATPRVEVVLVGEFGEDPWLAAILGEWLGRSDLAPTVSRASRLELGDLRRPEAAGAPVRLWLVRVREDLARVYLAEPGRGRYLVRDVPVAPGFDEVAREQLAQIVLSAALAFLAGAETSSLDDVERALGAEASRSPPAPPPNRPVTAPVAPPAAPAAAAADVPRLDRQRYLEGGVLVGVADQGPAGPAWGPGVRLGLGRCWGKFRAGGSVEGGLRWPRAVTTEHTTLELDATTWAVAVNGGSALASHLSWQVGVGGGVEIVKVAAAPRDPDLIVGERLRETSGFLRLSLGPGVQWPGVRAGIAGYVDGFPAGLRYEVREGDVRHTELVVPRIQPGVAVTVELERSVPARRATGVEAPRAAPPDREQRPRAAGATAPP